MSKPRYWWHFHIKLAIGRYKLLKQDSSDQADILLKAIRKAEQETSKLPDGELKLRAVKMVLKDRTHTFDGAALKLYVSEKTVHNWCNSFVRLVGRYAGYMGKK